MVATTMADGPRWLMADGCAPSLASPNGLWSKIHCAPVLSCSCRACQRLPRPSFSKAYTRFSRRRGCSKHGKNSRPIRSRRLGVGSYVSFSQVDCLSLCTQPARHAPKAKAKALSDKSEGSGGRRRGGAQGSMDRHDEGAWRRLPAHLGGAGRRELHESLSAGGVNCRRLLCAREVVGEAVAPRACRSC